MVSMDAAQQLVFQLVAEHRDVPVQGVLAEEAPVLVVHVQLALQGLRQGQPRNVVRYRCSVSVMSLRMRSRAERNRASWDLPLLSTTTAAATAMATRTGTRSALMEMKSSLARSFTLRRL